MTINDLIAETGLSKADFARQLGIPYRTIQNWALGVRQPPDYLLRLMAEHFKIAAP